MPNVMMISRDSDPILTYDICFVFMFHVYPALCYVGNDFLFVVLSYRHPAHV